MIGHPRFFSAAALLAVLFSTDLSAQPARSFAGVVPMGRTLNRLAEARFDRGDGLRSATAYAIERDAAGRLWLAAEDGLYEYAAGTWRREPLPDAVASQQVRALLFSADGTRWFGTRRGIVRQRVGQPMQYLGRTDSLAARVAFSLAESRAIDGSLRVVAGLSSGVVWFDGNRFVPLALPAGISPLGLVVRATVNRDSVPELWVASSLGGVARYARGVWTTYSAAEGMTSPDAQVLLDVPGGVSRLLVAGSDGVFALDSAERRFDRLPGSPTRAYRLAYVPGTDAKPRLWVGTTDGRLFEQRGSNDWTDVPLTIAERRGPITLLHALPRPKGGTAVYVSARGAFLSRVSLGAAGALELAAGDGVDAIAGVIAVPGSNGRDELWLRTLRSGLIYVSANGVVQRFARSTGAPFDVTRDVSMVSTDGVRPVGMPAPRPQIVVASDQGVFAYRGSSFVAMNNGLGGRVPIRVRRVQLLDGRSALLAGTDNGLFEWNGSRWTPSAIAVTGTVSSIRDGEGVLYLGGAHVVHRVSASGTVVERLPDVGVRGIGLGLVSAICRATVGSAAFLFAHDSERGVFWRPERATSPWSPLPEHLTRTLSAMGTTSVECRDSQLFLPTLAGLAVVDVANANPAAWSVSAQLARADGLPSSELSSVATSGVANMLWVGTNAGVGLVDVAAAARERPFRFELRVTAASSGRRIADGASLKQNENTLQVEPLLFTGHREAETRYRARLERRGGWFGGRDSASRTVTDSGANAWMDVSNRLYSDLEAGDYDLDAWALDWAGREYGPLRYTLRVESSSWLSWYAIALYIALAALLLVAAFRWRVNVIRTNGLQLLESERRLRESERKFRTIFDRAMDAQLLLENGQVITANARAAELFGVALPDDLHERTASSLLGLTPDDGGHTPPPHELVVTRGDETVPVQCTATTVPTEGSFLRHLVLRDLTAVRQAEAEKAWFEAQVREAQKLESLGTLAGGVAHDFNNLLGVIRGNAELAKSALRRGRSNEENLGAILDASDRARDVVRQILTFSRRSTPTREYVNLSRLVLDLLPLLRRMIPRTVCLVLEGEQQAQLIMGDPTQLQQLMLNLVSNAEYAMRSRTDGVLTIALMSQTVPVSSAAPTGDVVVLQVRDTGEGMTADVRNRIFEPFFTTKPTGEGTGLGMAVLHGIVESHLGHAEVVSTVGEGTTFELRFPRAVIEGLWDVELDGELDADLDADLDLDGDLDGSASTRVTVGGAADDAEHDLAISAVAYGAAMDAAESDVLDQSPYAGACIVVVDDEAGVARVVERALQHYGHAVHVFAEPALALAFIRSQPSAVDLLITDQTMPVMTGDMLAEAVHQLRPEMPVLILTGFSHRLTPERVAAAGAQAVLLKPVALDDLRRAVDDALASAWPAGPSL